MTYRGDSSITKGRFFLIEVTDQVSFTVVENKDNNEELERFRTAVEDINRDIFGIIISASYLFFLDWGQLKYRPV
ncbi:hypothetical protein V7121_22140 [Neobacillus drentensis]